MARILNYFVPPAQLGQVIPMLRGPRKVPGGIV